MLRTRCSAKRTKPLSAVWLGDSLSFGTPPPSHDCPLARLKLLLPQYCTHVTQFFCTHTHSKTQQALKSQRHGSLTSNFTPHPNNHYEPSPLTNTHYPTANGERAADEALQSGAHTEARNRSTTETSCTLIPQQHLSGRTTRGG